MVYLKPGLPQIWFTSNLLYWTLLYSSRNPDIFMCYYGQIRIIALTVSQILLAISLPCPCSYIFPRGCISGCSGWDCFFSSQLVLQPALWTRKLYHQGPHKLLYSLANQDKMSQTKYQHILTRKIPHFPPINTRSNDYNLFDKFMKKQ